MKNKELRNIVFCALLIALVIIGTIIIRIPIPAVAGYVHFGDLFIFLGSCIFGPIIGGIAGGLGSASADILVGASQWAVFSLIIKSLIGFVVGKFAYKHKFHSLRNLIGIIIAIVILVIGYYIVGSILLGSFKAGLVSIPYDIAQGVVSGVVYFVIGEKISKIKIIKGE
ncbi:ECF transporter S component [Miniphocaeibacter massiliensis]|uniref:ECF transporter S component n=1 Tax=Miniphocaeibacter massiliensis TaxID=2041841 RepID=UPI000C06C7E5|nr:ECF transporter S component [Miniphocaeibacter massiliensis]